MVKLTKRLEAVAELVRENSVLADIGCDHGYLPVFLLLNGKIKSAIASDINQGPLDSCKALVEEYKLNDSVKCIISNGLQNINCGECNDISICGMGGELIAQILSECKWAKSSDNHYVFNPMTHPEILRKYLCENGYEIGRDFIVKEGKRYYNVLEAVYKGKPVQADEVYYYIGNINDFRHKEYFEHMLNFLENKMKGGSDYSKIIAAVKEKNMTTVKNVYDYINSVAPFDTQEEWDNSGFLIGEFRKKVEKAVLTLDVTKSVAEYAAEIGADLIISHHPVIFSGLKELKKGDSVFICVEKGISVISAHTNYDAAIDGINDNLCTRLELKNVKKIENTFINTGELDCEMSIDDFAEFVKEKLCVNGLRYTDTEKSIKTVAVGGGACEEFTDEAIRLADCFLTGDMKYHKMLDCAEKGFAVISAGHFETESESFHMFLNKLQTVFPDVEFVWGEQKNPVLAV